MDRFNDDYMTIGESGLVPMGDMFWDEASQSFKEYEDLDGEEDNIQDPDTSNPGTARDD